MSDVAAMRAFNRELAAVVGATVEVVINTGKTYSGTLKGIDQNTLSIILSDVVADGETNIPKIFIYGS
jgi:small nuclear ribonucleoprotein (snRNP)-like protein